MRISGYFAVVFCIATLTLSAQSRIGVSFDYNRNIHQVDFRAFPGTPSCCPAYESGSGGGIAFGLIGRFPISVKSDFIVRADYNQFNGTLVRQELLSLAGNVPGTVEHSVSCTLPALQLELLYQFQFPFGMWLSSGLCTGFYLSPHFSQKELITSPSSGTFENGLRSRNVYDNVAIPDVNTLNLGLRGGLHYDLPMREDSSIVLSPELRGGVTVTSAVTDAPWIIFQVQLGACLYFPLSGHKTIPERHIREEHIDTLRIPSSTPIAGVRRGMESSTERREQGNDETLVIEHLVRHDTLDVRIASIPTPPSPQLEVLALDSNGTESALNVLRFEEYRSFPTTPLLPYVFFDENSSQIPSRYDLLDAASVATFHVVELHSDERMNAYHELLNIVAERMLAAPNAQLRIVGCNADVGVEKSNTTLSQRRAQSVRDYLHNAWNIPLSRLHIEQRNLPEQAANTATTDGAEENRRAELYCDDPAVLAPLQNNATMVVVQPSAIRFRLQNMSAAELATARIDIMQGPVTLETLHFTNGIAQLDWPPSAVSSSLFNHVDSLSFNLVSGASGGLLAQSRVAVNSLSVEQKRSQHTADEEISRFALMTFDIRSSAIHESNKELTTYIRQHISPDSKISVVGYADRSGDAQNNVQLALGRARSMAKELSLGPTAEVRAETEHVPYDQNIPEGRMYSRTVEVTVSTPVPNK